METALAPTPATLASATSIDDPVIDPALHDNPAYTEPHTAIAQEDLDAATAEIINASIRTAAQAHAAAEAAEAVVAEAVAEAEADLATPQADSTDADAASASKDKSFYPYVRPQRDESTPYPLLETYESKADFEVWLAEESSWCHYVQRRVTNPEKRAEERARARDKAFDKKLASKLPASHISIADCQVWSRRKRRVCHPSRSGSGCGPRL
jgi:hypothetical protein